LATDVVIHTQQLTRRFGDLTAVNNLDLSIKRESIYGFLGPNGSGKSTTIRMLCGLLVPTSGTVEVLGLQIPGQSDLLRTKIGYMTQEFSLFTDLTVNENLQFMAQIYDLSPKEQKTRISAALSTYQLQRFQHQICGTMSGGEKQRLALAAATLHKPELLFLDEPTSAVDPRSRRDFWESLFELVSQGVTILVSTHYMDEAERCHGLAILDHGVKVADDGPAMLMASLDAWVVRIGGENIGRMRSILLADPLVLSVAQLGVHMRVLLDKSLAEPVKHVQGLLAALPGNYPVEMVEPSLEDVFVVTTHKRNRGDT